MITQDKLIELLDYNQTSGTFYWRKSGKQAGSKHCRGYWQISIKRKVYLAHRLAWLYVHGKYPCKQIDHIDGDRMNNSIFNLRDVSGFLNQQNRKRSARNSMSGLLGAHFDKRTGRYNAHLSINGKSVHIGNYGTAEEAHNAYIEAKRVNHPGNTL